MEDTNLGLIMLLFCITTGTKNKTVMANEPEERGNTSTTILN